MTERRYLSADVIVVGTGPGGLAVGRELAMGGKKVIFFERGLDHRRRSYYGTCVGPMLYADRMGLLFSREGIGIMRPLMLGGATGMFYGSAAAPPVWLKRKYRIDIEADTAAILGELGVAPLPEKLRGAASTRIAAAADSLGYAWFPQPKFMNPDRGVGFYCGAACALGCRCGAKWNAAEYADDAVSLYNAELYTGARVDRVLVDDGCASGVEGVMGWTPFTARAGAVILAAGAIGTPRILQASGFEDAGVGMGVDAAAIVYGRFPGGGMAYDPPMAWSWENPHDGYMMSTLVDPRLVYPFAVARIGVRHALDWTRWADMAGIMIMIGDDISGGVFGRRAVRKPLTPSDYEKLSRAKKTAEMILLKAGAERSSIFMRPLFGAHPSATVRVGFMVDANCKTEADGLYVCDASVLPESPGRPPVLTILGLARRLARHLMKKR